MANACETIECLARENERRKIGIERRNARIAEFEKRRAFKGQAK